MDQRLRFLVDEFQDDWDKYIGIVDHAALVLPQASISMSPFELLNGFPPRTSFDWNTPVAVTVRQRLERADAVRIAKRIELAVESAKESMAKAQDRQAIAANRKRWAID